MSSRSPSPPPPLPSRRRRAPTVIARILAYFVPAWGAVIALSVGLFPGAWLVPVALAAYCTLPLLLFVRWRGWPFYPSAAFRLLVVRPALYGNLMLPIVAGAGILGLIGGAPFGHALAFGRVLALFAFVLVALVLFAGYAGSRWLVVRHVDAFVPGLAPSFDGLKIAQLSDLHVASSTASSARRTRSRRTSSPSRAISSTTAPRMWRSTRSSSARSPRRTASS
jgi:hypothetical protein